VKRVKIKYYYTYRDFFGVIYTPEGLEKLIFRNKFFKLLFPIMNFCFGHENSLTDGVKNT
jgi:hypothetical protein